MTQKINQGDELLDQLTSDSRQTRQVARRRMIAEAVMSEGSMRIEDLTDRFGISLMTAHRDVDELVSRGLFRKTRGIVTAAATNLIESSDVYRSSRQSAEKKAIAEAAMQFVEPGQAIFFDDSTTVLQMAPHLSSKVPITAITNSLTLMNALTGMHDVTLLALGGQYYNWCNAFMGRMTINEIRALRADVFFISMSAINEGIVLHQSPETVDTKRAMFDCSVKRILLADHTKFDRRALHSFAALDEFDVVIVDDRTPSVQIDRMRSKDINVVVARTGSGRV
ncbi:MULTISPECIES: DeoR/GlpR family DNA-binding transcription regulator [Rhizobium]|uniref:DeoR/GlpR transcriptional regulator n=1 Tax=Rhizobium bangladeshense TaxID=1138189 RepID=A0ABS7LIE3_9HYPH|nr:MULTISPECIES: DeoR/GlpR family DNA-binding transcription regulator [Rhizobium]MBX4867146.1 DeoR/GlpR transcriptional regulator [Rhizobium bangladeshense]MBX4871437.1 DeoR/GlpR transcriptional regulator [Rhizobium bangladeshense]MBX4882751.1 DeoR/GlpR transcriptional regulator [Rhizobium bangladeshense]MBX4891139.1 DeoR/GlpR transcriptional regulator [Rhizobium bangladeshense]MBX4897081.1 DeoR/GlpR transcriptional regulator [Rhizobium bangladeshense]